MPPKKFCEWKMTGVGHKYVRTSYAYIKVLYSLCLPMNFEIVCVKW